MELIGFSLAFGTDDIVTGKRSILWRWVICTRHSLANFTHRILSVKCRQTGDALYLFAVTTWECLFRRLYLFFAENVTLYLGVLTSLSDKKRLELLFIRFGKQIAIVRFW